MPTPMGGRWHCDAWSWEVFLNKNQMRLMKRGRGKIAICVYPNATSAQGSVPTGLSGRCTWLEASLGVLAFLTGPSTPPSWG